MRLILFSIIIIYSSLSFAQKSIVGYRHGEKILFNSKPIAITDTRQRPVLLESNASVKFNELIVAAAKAGIDIRVNYGYRTYAQQRYWYNKYKEYCKINNSYCGMAARPGFSSHQEGLSIDIAGCVRFFSKKQIEKMKLSLQKTVKQKCTKKKNGSYRCNTLLYWWLKRNAPIYGFYNDVIGEPWHWTFIETKELEINK